MTGFDSVMTLGSMLNNAFKKQDVFVANQAPVTTKKHYKVWLTMSNTLEAKEMYFNRW